MKIERIMWKEKFINKFIIEHHVSTVETEEILFGKKKVYRVTKGRVKGENVYLALGQTAGGRYLSVFFILKKNCRVLPISARDMDDKERRKYERK